MTEDSLLQSIRQRLSPAARSLVLGPGDDAAIYRPRRNQDLVFTTDMMHEDRHFLRSYDPYSVGWKALARGLSDIAAMGAKPEFALLSLALGEWMDESWVQGFYDGFLHLAEVHQLPLAGGDLARAKQGSMDVVVCGSVPRGKALRRGTARPGDSIYISGALGGGIVGLRNPENQEARAKHLRPEPRVSLGLALRKRGIPSAMMDLSDGLSTDLRRMLLESGVSATLDGALPLFAGATEADALHGGDDYELLFTSCARVPRTLAGNPLHLVGRVTEGEPGTILRAGTPIDPLGWDHFRG
jgi:thiamine-monophosphate kinase